MSGFRLSVIIAGALQTASVGYSALIDVGNHNLLPNTPNQSIAIQVSGGELVAGADLFAQVGDGGPELINVGLPAGTDAPEISGVDLTTGTIFGNTAAQIDQDRAGVVQLYFSSVALTLPPPAAQEVAADGLLATLTIDTTGFTSGTFDLLLGGVLPGHSNGPFDTQLIASGGMSVATTILNGTVSIDALACDFDSDGLCDNTDIDALGAVVLAGTHDLAFDLTGDMLVNNADRDQWLAIAAAANGFGQAYMLGDANLDGSVDEIDYLVWKNTRFSAVNPVAPWSDADWTFDGLVDGFDLLAWNHNKFTSIDLNTVPEPNGLLWFGLGSLVLAMSRMFGSGRDVR